MLIAYKSQSPQIDPTAYVQQSAQIIGDVAIGAQSSIWFNVVIRGDVHAVRIGARSNIQDNSTVHVTSGHRPTIIGDEVTVGHAVVLHGCHVGNRCLIGIGSTVLDGVEIADDCLIGAGSLLAPGTKVPRFSLVKGTPARVVRRLNNTELAHLKASPLSYIDLAANYREQQI